LSPVLKGHGLIRADKADGMPARSARESTKCQGTTSVVPQTQRESSLGAARISLRDPEFLSACQGL